jgi:uncharacterized protein YcaQ
MPIRDSISITEARRVALAAQQFAPAHTKLTRAALSNLVRELGVVQMDSVNVLVRTHYLPAFSRRGIYRRAWLDELAYERPGAKLFEYWGHEASLLPIEHQPLFRWRMENARNGVGIWSRLRRYALEHQDLVANTLAQIREKGPLSASELDGSQRGKGSWWGWSQAKEIMEWLFWTGQVSTSERRNFERRYDLTERIIPKEIYEQPTPPKADAQRKLLEIGARSVGVGTLRDLRDYFRLPTADASERLRELVEEGALIPVRVEGWKQQAYLHRATRIPKHLSVSALLSPFDSLIWERDRTERLFNFSYRLEIYTPAHKRKHGYYVLPFLLDGQIVARVDLKADRSGSALEVRGGSTEPHARVQDVAGELCRALAELAEWLELDTVSIKSRKGDLMRALRAPKGRVAPAK